MLSLADGARFLAFPLRSQDMVKDFALPPCVTANKALKPGLLRPIHPCLQRAWCRRATFRKTWKYGNHHQNREKVFQSLGQCLHKRRVTAPHDHVNKIPVCRRGALPLFSEQGPGQAEELPPPWQYVVPLDVAGERTGRTQGVGEGRVELDKARKYTQDVSFKLKDRIG